MWILDTNALIICIKQRNKDLFKLNYSYTTIFSLIEYPIAINQTSLTYFYPNFETYNKSIEYTSKLRKKGTPIPAIDILIGTMSSEQNMILVSNDKHFTQFQDVEPKLQVIGVNDYIQNILDIE